MDYRNTLPYKYDLPEQYMKKTCVSLLHKQKQKTMKKLLLTSLEITLYIATVITIFYSCKWLVLNLESTMSIAKSTLQ